MAVLWLLIVGAAAGFLATRLMGVNLPVITTVVFGMAGALLGGAVLYVLVGILGALGGFLGAVLAAMALIWGWQTYFGGKE